MNLLTRTQHLGTAAILLGVSIFLSRFMGLIRAKVISYYYGAGMEADIFFAAFVIPDFINYLLAGGYFSITLIPLLTRRFAESEDSGWQLFSTIFWWVCVASTACVALAWIFAPRFALMTTPGFVKTPEAMDKLVLFLRIILPGQMFFLPGACLSALLYMRKQFAAPAIMPLIYNGAIILGGVAMLYIMPERGMEGFCWGVLVGAFIGAFLLPLLVVRANGFRLSFSLRDKDFVTFTLLALPLMLGQSIVVLEEQFIRIFGSLASEGSVSLLVYARRVALVPAGIVAQAAGVATYPFLASLAVAGDTKRFDETLATAARHSLALAIPICTWMGAAAMPIMRLLFEQGKFTAESTYTSALLLVIMLPAMVCWVIHQLVSRAFYAREDTLTPAVIGTLVTILFLPVYWGLVRIIDSYGIAAAGSLAVIAYTVGLTWIWTRRHGDGAIAGILPFLTLGLAICVLPSAIAFAVAIKLPVILPVHPLIGAALALACSGLAFGIIYIACAWRFAPQFLVPVRIVTDACIARIRRKR